MYCTNCGAELNTNGNFCPYCGARLETATVSTSLMTKAVTTAQNLDQYNIVLVSRGECDAVTAGDLLEDVFGYTDAESGNLVRMAPIVVGENLNAEEASSIAQLLTEYGLQVSIIDHNDQYVDLTDTNAGSVFDLNGNLLSGVAAIIGALTVANRITSYRRFKKPSLIDRIFRIHYKPAAPAYRRSFRPRLDAKAAEPRRTIRRPAMSRTHAGNGQAGRQNDRRDFQGSPSSHGTHGNQHNQNGHNGPKGKR